MAVPIRYPDTTGDRADSSSVQLKVNREEFLGWSDLECGGKRAREYVKGPNADVLGKTRGKNEFNAKLSVYIAEFIAFMVTRFGNGWMDQKFTVEYTITANGYDTIYFVIYGCTFGGWSFKASTSGADPLKIEDIDLMPTKIVVNGFDDNARPLTAAAAIG